MCWEFLEQNDTDGRENCLLLMENLKIKNLHQHKWHSNYKNNLKIRLLFLFLKICLKMKNEGQPQKKYQ